MVQQDRDAAAPAPGEKTSATSAPAPAFFGSGQVPVLTALSRDGVLALQRTAGNLAVARLVENYAGDQQNAKPPTSTAIDIANLTEQRAAAHLRRLRAGGAALPLTQQHTITQGRTTWIYDVGDDVALAGRQHATKGDTLRAFLAGLGGDAAEAQHRNVQAPIADLQQFVTQMSQGQGSPGVANLEEWLLVSERFNNPEQRFDALNELREAAAQPVGGGPVDLAESTIPGTTQTADLKQGQTQSEVKTVRDPVRQPNELNAQLGAALTKFRQAGGTNKPVGARYRAVVYGSYHADLFPGGPGNRKLDASTGNVTTQFNPSNSKTEWFFQGTLKQLTTNAFGDISAADEIAIRMENGPGAVFENHNGTWVRR